MNLQAEQFAELLSMLNLPALDANDMGRRRAFRVDVSAEIQIEPRAPEGQPARPVKVPVCDLSCRGIAILSDVPLPANSTFLIRLQCKTTAPVQVVCTVVHSKPADGRFRIGAEFTGVISIDEASSDSRPGIAEQIMDAIPGR